MVTGASGFIGSPCLGPLLAAGFEIHAVQRRERAHAPRQKLQWHRADLLDPAAVERLIDTVRPTHLLHLAWFVQHDLFWSAPDNFEWVKAGVHLFEAFGRANGRFAVAVGSGAEYDPAGGQCDEIDTPTRPESVYAQSKLKLSTALFAHAERYGFGAAWLRLFYPYGPGEAEGRLIPTVVRSICAKQPMCTTHLRQVRDLLFIDDVAAAIAAVLEREASGVFNVASGQPVRLAEVVEEIVAQIGGKELVRIGERAPRPGDPPLLVANISRIVVATGWSPRTSLREGIARTIAACGQPAPRAATLSAMPGNWN